MPFPGLKTSADFLKFNEKVLQRWKRRARIHLAAENIVQQCLMQKPETWALTPWRLLGLSQPPAP